MTTFRRKPTTRRRAPRAALGGAAATALLVLFAVASGATPATAGASVDALSEEDELCLSCHADEGLERELADGEMLSLHVRGEAFAESVHGLVGCRGCHSDIELETHPPADRSIGSRRAYTVQASRVCAQCHSDASLKDGPEHHAYVSTAGEPACAECHQAHSIDYIGQWKASVGEAAYCLTCHGRALSLALENGGSHSLSIDYAVLRKSVHLDHECTDCHVGFAKDAHSARGPASEQEPSAARAEICRQCHEDKFEQYAGSIHAALLDAGDTAAPTCTNCHGSHSVGPKAAYETIAGLPCRKCHEDVFDAYASSVHGEARTKLGHIEAPVCADCHRAHDVGAPSVGNRLKEACIGCHKDTLSVHKTWLPNAERHLEVVLCPACHAPAAQRRIDLRLYDATAQEFVSEPDHVRRFETGKPPVNATAEALDALELWKLLREFNRDETGRSMTLRGRLEVRAGVEAHRLSDHTRAVRDCESCHREDAEPFQSVTVSIVGPNGRPVHYAADKEVLTSAISVDSLRGFYAPGATRIKLLDVLLVLALFGGVSVPVGHLTMKWLFRVFRKRGAGVSPPKEP